MDIEQVRAEIGNELKTAAALVGEGTLDGPSLWDFVNLVEGCWYDEKPDTRKAWRYTVTRYVMQRESGSAKELTMAEGVALSSWLLKQDDTCEVLHELLAQALRAEGQMDMFEGDAA